MAGVNWTNKNKACCVFAVRQKKKLLKLQNQLREQNENRLFFFLGGGGVLLLLTKQKPNCNLFPLNIKRQKDIADLLRFFTFTVLTQC